MRFLIRVGIAILVGFMLAIALLNPIGSGGRQAEREAKAQKQQELLTYRYDEGQREARYAAHPGAPYPVATFSPH